MPDLKHIENEVLPLLSSILEINAEEINIHTTMNQISAWDSLKHLNIIIELEQHFKIEIEDTEAPGLVDVKSIVGLIQNKTKLKFL